MNMDLKDILVIFGCLYFLGFMIYYFATKDKKINRANNEIPKDAKEQLLKSHPIDVSDETVKQNFKFNWKKLLIMDGFVILLLGLGFLKESYNKDMELMTYVKVCVFLILLLDIIAACIDFIRWLINNANKNNLYVIPVFKHSDLKGYCFISYRDVSERKIISARVKISEDDMRYTFDNSINYAIVKIKGDKVKYVKMLKR